MHPINQGLMRRPCSRGTPCPTRPPTAQVGDTGDTLNTVLLAQSWLATWLWKKKKKGSLRALPAPVSHARAVLAAPHALHAAQAAPYRAGSREGSPDAGDTGATGPHGATTGTPNHPQHPWVPLRSASIPLCVRTRGRGGCSHALASCPPPITEPPLTQTRRAPCPGLVSLPPPGPAQPRQPQTRAVVGLWALIMRTGAPAPPEIRGTVPVRMCRVPPAPQG